MTQSAATPPPVLADVEDFLAWVQRQRETTLALAEIYDGLSFPAPGAAAAAAR